MFVVVRAALVFPAPWRPAFSCEQRRLRAVSRSIIHYLMTPMISSDTFVVNIDSIKGALMAPRGIVEITSAQCRAARGFLRWSVQDVADKARVGKTTVIRFENERVVPATSTTTVIRQAFERAGVEFPDKFTVRYIPQVEAPEADADDGGEPE
jgi:predicted transcriptional regulator